MWERNYKNLRLEVMPYGRSRSNTSNPLKNWNVSVGILQIIMGLNHQENNNLCYF